MAGEDKRCVTAEVDSEVWRGEGSCNSLTDCIDVESGLILSKHKEGPTSPDRKPAYRSRKFQREWSKDLVCLLQDLIGRERVIVDSAVCLDR